MRRPWWDRLLCRIGSHDWRHMDGRCATCGYCDPLWAQSAALRQIEQTDGAA